MSVVNVLNINVLDNPCAFTNPFQFEVTFECLAPLKHDLEWRVTYVGSAEKDSCDQELDSVLVGPVPVGMNKFVLQTKAADATKIPAEDLLGVTVVLITCSYKEQEFIRVGYYVNNSHPDYAESAPGPSAAAMGDDDDVDMADESPESAAETKREVPVIKDFSTVVRSILASQPRVTRFTIDWNVA